MADFFVYIIPSYCFFILPSAGRYFHKFVANRYRPFVEAFGHCFRLVLSGMAHSFRTILIRRCPIFGLRSIVLVLYVHSCLFNLESIIKTIFRFLVLAVWRFSSSSVAGYLQKYQIRLCRNYCLRLLLLF